MSDMLQFEPNKRPTALQCAERWNSLLRPWVPPVEATSLNENDIEFRHLVGYLRAVSSGTAGMSSRQWERAVTAIENLKQNLDPDKRAILDELGEKIREIRQSVPA